MSSEDNDDDQFEQDLQRAIQLSLEQASNPPPSTNVDDDFEAQLQAAIAMSLQDTGPSPHYNPPHQSTTQFMDTPQRRSHQTASPRDDLHIPHNTPSPKQELPGRSNTDVNPPGKPITSSTPPLVPTTGRVPPPSLGDTPQRRPDKDHSGMDEKGQEERPVGKQRFDIRQISQESRSRRERQRHPQQQPLSKNPPPTAPPQATEKKQSGSHGSATTSTHNHPQHPSNLIKGTTRQGSTPPTTSHKTSTSSPSPSSSSHLQTKRPPPVVHDCPLLPPSPAHCDIPLASPGFFLSKLPLLSKSNQSASTSPRPIHQRQASELVSPLDASYLSVSYKELIAGTVNTRAVIFSCVIDPVWFDDEFRHLLSTCPTIDLVTPQTDDQFELLRQKYPNCTIRSHKPWMDSAYGVQHAKLILLFNPHGIRMICSTGNLEMNEMVYKSQSHWVQDFPLKSNSHTPPPPIPHPILSPDDSSSPPSPSNSSHFFQTPSLTSSGSSSTVKDPCTHAIISNITSILKLTSHTLQHIQTTQSEYDCKTHHITPSHTAPLSSPSSLRSSQLHTYHTFFSMLNQQLVIQSEALYAQHVSAFEKQLYLFIRAAEHRCRFADLGSGDLCKYDFRAAIGSIVSTVPDPQFATSLYDHAQLRVRHVLTALSDGNSQVDQFDVTSPDHYAHQWSKYATPSSIHSMEGSHGVDGKQPNSQSQSDTTIPIQGIDMDDYNVYSSIQETCPSVIQGIGRARTIWSKTDPTVLVSGCSSALQHMLSSTGSPQHQQSQPSDNLANQPTPPLNPYLFAIYANSSLLHPIPSDVVLQLSSIGTLRPDLLTQLLRSLSMPPSEHIMKMFYSHPLLLRYLYGTQKYQSRKASSITLSPTQGDSNNVMLSEVIADYQAIEIPAKLIWPSKHQVFTSIEGPQAGGWLLLNKKNINVLLWKMFAQYKQAYQRNAIMPHIKSYTQCLTLLPSHLYHGLTASQQRTKHGVPYTLLHLGSNHHMSWESLILTTWIKHQQYIEKEKRSSPSSSSSSPSPSSTALAQLSPTSLSSLSNYITQLILSSVGNNHHHFYSTSSIASTTTSPMASSSSSSPSSRDPPIHLNNLLPWVMMASQNLSQSAWGVIKPIPKNAIKHVHDINQHQFSDELPKTLSKEATTAIKRHYTRLSNKPTSQSAKYRSDLPSFDSTHQIRCSEDLLLHTAVISNELYASRVNRKDGDDGDESGSDDNDEETTQSSRKRQATKTHRTHDDHRNPPQSIDAYSTDHAYTQTTLQQYLSHCPLLFSMMSVFGIHRHDQLRQFPSLHESSLHAKSKWNVYYSHLVPSLLKQLEAQSQSTGGGQSQLTKISKTQPQQQQQQQPRLLPLYYMLYAMFMCPAYETQSTLLAALGIGQSLLYTPPPPSSSSSSSSPSAVAKGALQTTVSSQNNPIIHPKYTSHVAISSFPARFSPSQFLSQNHFEMGIILTPRQVRGVLNLISRGYLPSTLLDYRYVQSSSSLSSRTTTTATTSTQQSIGSQQESSFYDSFSAKTLNKMINSCISPIDSHTHHNVSDADSPDDGEGPIMSTFNRLQSTLFTPNPHLAGNSVYNKITTILNYYASLMAYLPLLKASCVSPLIGLGVGSDIMRYNDIVVNIIQPQSLQPFPYITSQLCKPPMTTLSDRLSPSRDMFIAKMLNKSPVSYQTGGRTLGGSDRGDSDGGNTMDAPLLIPRLKQLMYPHQNEPFVDLFHRLHFTLLAPLPYNINVDKYLNESQMLEFFSARQPQQQGKQENKNGKDSSTTDLPRALDHLGSDLTPWYHDQ